MLEKVTVVDIEALCWPYENDKEESQIIEIGICTLHTKTLRITDKRSIYVKPVYGRVGKFCKDLTGLTQKHLDTYGIPYGKAVKSIMTDYKSRRHPWASWGDFDKEMFRKHADYSKLPKAYGEFPFTNHHIDVKHLLSTLTGEPYPLSLADAVESIGKPFQGKQHCAADDAYNTAVMLSHIFLSFREGNLLLTRPEKPEEDWSI